MQDGGPRPVITAKAAPIVTFAHNFPINSIVIDASRRKLYFVLEERRAYEYSVAVGRKGFSWTGTETVSNKQVWPDWYPPPEMRERDPLAMFEGRSRRAADETALNSIVDGKAGDLPR